MNIQAINSPNFCSKKFRLPVKTAIVGNMRDGIANKKVNWVKEYSNPNAKNLWEQAMNETSLTKKLNLIDEMGEYRLVDLEQEKFIAKAFKKIQGFVNKSEK